MAHTPSDRSIYKCGVPFVLLIRVLSEPSIERTWNSTLSLYISVPAIGQEDNFIKLRPTRIRENAMKRENRAMGLFLPVTKSALTSILFLICNLTFAQITGVFQVAQDGHVYFYASNYTNYNFNVRIIAVSSNGNNSEDRYVASGSGFYIGPTTPWKLYWKSGDKVSVVYQNGQSQTWTCNQTDASYRGNVSFGASASQRIWYGEGNPANSRSDGYTKTSRITEVGGYKYHVYSNNGNYYIYDKNKGWCKLR